MLPNYTDSGLTNIMKDEKLRNDYMDTRYSRLEKGLSKSQNSGGAVGMNGNKIWKNRISAIILIVAGALFGGSFDSTKISLGDRLFSVLGIPAWSDGTTGLHYSGMIGFIVIIIGIGMLNVTLEKWTRIWIWVVCIAIFVLLGFTGCGQKTIEIDEEQAVFHAKEYAKELFEKDMPEDTTIDSIAASIGEIADDNIYLVRICYRNDDAKEYQYYYYRVLIDETGNSVVKEVAELKEEKEESTWYVEQDGNMYYCHTTDIVWRLAVIDAATGSRLYVLEKSEHGSKASYWNIINENPFDSQWGVAQGLKFYDESFGFASISSVDESNSSVYVTRDGGVTFEKIVLPMDTITELPAEAEELEYTVDDYDYMFMPEKEENTWYITVTTAKLYKNGITFSSVDNGVTWQVVE